MSDETLIAIPCAAGIGALAGIIAVLFGADLASARAIAFLICCVVLWPIRGAVRRALQEAADDRADAPVVGQLEFIVFADTEASPAGVEEWDGRRFSWSRRCRLRR